MSEKMSNRDRLECALRQIEVLPIAWDRSCIPDDIKLGKTYKIPACTRFIPYLARAVLEIYVGYDSITWTIRVDRNDPPSFRRIYAEGFVNRISGYMVIRRTLPWVGASYKAYPHTYAVGPINDLSVMSLPPVYERTFIEYA